MMTDAADPTMTVDEALALKRCIAADIPPLADEWRSFGGPHWDLRASLPEDDTLYVVTNDGVTFSVLLFSGAYSSRMEWTVDNEGEWDVHLAGLKREMEQERERHRSRVAGHTVTWTIAPESLDTR